MPELIFKGKEFVYNHHLAVPHRPLVPNPAKGIGEGRLDDNLIIHGDNLHALKSLLPLYAGKVDCIFIDPIYNTGNEGWCYNDNVNSPMLQAWFKENPIGVEDGLRHDKWCAMMWPRLRLLHELLGEAGSFWMTLDDNEIHRGRAMLDEIFGEANFVACCIWHKNYSPKPSAQFFSEDHDYLLVYAKDKSVWRPNLLERTEEMDARYSNPDNDPRGKWKPGDLSARNYYSEGTYLTELAARKTNADRVAELARQNPTLHLPIPDFAAEAWEALRAAGKLPGSRSAIPYSPRQDGMGRPVPNVVFKVPTGGGKTFLAVEALSKIFGRYLGRHHGFVLWIVPNEAIYSQTKKQLIDRQHPYRQLLDVLSGQRVRILEKDDHLDARDVGGHLCVMLLMLQSGNRENKDSLKMFRDRGDVRGFFPPEDDQEAHEMAKRQTPNLDAYNLGDSAYPWFPVKDSLGNALRLIRPVVVMDEGHKAVSELAFGTLYGFNPCFVLELTATPKDVAATGGRNPRDARYSNVLVQVQGIDLDREGMIKMPLNLDPRGHADWRHTLAAALERLRGLDEAARLYQADSGRYIRPILLVQVERTGADQRDGAHVHALDAREWLMTVGGLDEAEIAIKTADTNDLAAPENQDLLSPTNRVRVIITKQALQEGWDCPFAYVLCVLAASGNFSALTQLVGRILRQPHARKTGVAALDESYVLTHHANTADVVEAIKKGLEEDGMGDLVREVRVTDPGSPKGPRKVPRRPAFAKTQIYLPQVLRVADCVVRELDYEEDILFALDWLGLDVSPFVDGFPLNAQTAEQQLQRFRLTDSGDQRVVAEAAGVYTESHRFDMAQAVRMLTDIVPNAWWARSLVGEVVAGLTARGLNAERMGALSGLIVESLRAWLDGVRHAKAEAHFRAEVAAGRIQFRLRTDDRNWRMPFEAETHEPEGADQLAGGNGQVLQKSLFAPIYRGDFSSKDERDVAVYLDGDKALTWWHRNVAKSHYAITGWRREKVYPDFIFAVRLADDGKRLVLLEMKGEHLAGNADTDYKRSLLQLMTESFSVENMARVGEMELVDINGVEVACDLVLMPEWKTRLPEFFAGALTG